MTKDFIIQPHTADMQIQIFGDTLPLLFTNGLIGMFNAMHPKSKLCHYANDRMVCSALPIKRAISITSPDTEALLVDFLSEALTLADINNEIYLKVDFEQFTKNSLQAQLYGIAIDGYEGIEVKAVTYHALSIQQINGKWQACIVFDI